MTTAPYTEYTLVQQTIAKHLETLLQKGAKLSGILL